MHSNGSKGGKDFKKSVMNVDENKQNSSQRDKNHAKNRATAKS